MMYIKIVYITYLLYNGQSDYLPILVHMLEKPVQFRNKYLIFTKRKISIYEPFATWYPFYSWNFFTQDQISLALELIHATVGLIPNFVVFATNNMEMFCKLWNMMQVFMSKWASKEYIIG